MSHKTLVITIATLNFTLLMNACFISKKEPPIPTGITTRPTGQGKGIQLEATGRASMRAIHKNSPAMMQSTSCEAARLLLANELKKPAYQSSRGRFINKEIFILRNGEYCKIAGIFN